MISGQTKPIIFFGTENFSLISLKALVESGFIIDAVVTKPDSKKGRGQKLIAPAVKTYAETHGITVLQPTKLTDISEYLEHLDMPIGVLVSFGKIIPQSTLGLFSPGIINVHPSLLPKYRGPSPIESAIKHRDEITGVTIMKLEAKMDAGPIYTQVTVPLNGTETQSSLYQTLGRLGAIKLVETLPAIMAGTLLPEPQDESAATYCGLLEKSESYIDPSTMTTHELEAKIRAHQDFPRTKYEFHGHLLTILASEISNTPKSALSIECADGNFVTPTELIAPSGKRMNADSFLRGYAA